MWRLRGRSRIMDHDERLPFLREGDVIYVDGKPVKRDPLRFDVPCNVQPLTGRQLLLLPEGDRQKEQFNIYQPEVVGVPKVLVGDKVWRNGAVFVVQQAADWGSYVQARMVRQDVPGGLPDFEPIAPGTGAVVGAAPEGATL